MVRRKGELSKAGIDRGWPHQVALPAEVIRGRNYTIIDRFCRGLSVCQRHQRYRLENEEFIVYCFGEERDAEFFHMHFGGDRMTPETRPNWPPGRRRT
jgi:hypothetical protein